MKIIKGDLFRQDPSIPKAQCIACDARMGAGIAVQFANRYRGMREYILLRRPHVGSCILYRDRGETVLNLITKQYSNGKPTYESLRAALEDMVQICKRDNIKQIAMPAIGCGLDRLEWSRVSAMIDDVCRDFDVTVCML